MAASSNESFGLKIATAFSIALTVVLLVSVYFLNSSYNLEYEKRAKAEADANKAAALTRSFTDSLHRRQGPSLGYAGDRRDRRRSRPQMKKDQEQLKAEVQAIQKDVNDIVAEFQKKAEGKGVDASPSTRPSRPGPARSSTASSTTPTSRTRPRSPGSRT